MVCPECGHDKSQTDHTRGEVSCTKCGLVLEDNMVEHSDKEFFGGTPDNPQSRVGAPLTHTITDKGLRTNMGPEFRSMKLPNKSKYYRMDRWNRKQTNKERMLKPILDEIQRMSSCLNLPNSIEEDASKIAFDFKHTTTTRGRGYEIVATAALITACKRNCIPKTIKEILKPSVAEEKIVLKTYKQIQRKLNIKIIPENPICYIPRICVELNIQEQEQKHIVHLVDDTYKKGLIGSPTIMIGGCINLVMRHRGKKLTLKRIAAACDTTEASIRTKTKYLLDQLQPYKKPQ